MTMIKFTAAATLVVALAACEGPATLKAAPGQTATEVTRSIALTRGIALGIGLVCSKRGIGLMDPDIRGAVNKDIRNLVAQGYDRAEVEQGFAKTAGDKSLRDASIAYLEKRGARKGDPASVCAVGQKEITAGTPVGKLLKRI